LPSGVDLAWLNAPTGVPVQALFNNDTSGFWWITEPVPGKSEYFWLQLAEGGAVIGINPQGGIGPGSQLQLQRKDHGANQWWTAVEAPGRPGHYWLISAVGGLVIEIGSTATGPGPQLQLADRRIGTEQWWTWADVPLVSPPTSGLWGNHNYFLAGGYDQATGFIPLNEVVVTIQLTEDLIGGTQFSFQLNCWSPNPTMQEQRTDGPLYDVWQQYGLQGGFWLGDKVASFAENWPSSGLQLFEIQPPGFYRIADGGKKMLAGTYTTINPTQLGGLTGPISGSRVVVSDATQTARQDIKIIGSPLISGGKATSNDLAPIAALQMNIVAWGTITGQPFGNTVFTSGAGTIEYFSSTPMTVLNGPLADVDALFGTGETSTMTYGELPQGTSNRFLQTFTAAPVFYF
jgi:hypothetical protein